SELAEFLRECRAGDYECNSPFCPICARVFRRWFTAELIRVTKGHDPVYIYTVLLKEAPHDKINDLDPTPYRHQLRKRLERAGLGQAPVIGGFEIVYKAKRRVWVLHVNLVVIGGKQRAREKFEKSSAKNGEVERSIVGAKLNDRAEQLSYILKFGTYHRPHEQRGAKKSKAKPLNPREHAALVKWMSQFEFKNFLFLVNAIRRRSKITVRGQPDD
ncbi:MAG: hypothetical protein ACXWJB_14855, partial [Limisphaerales bacterium]